MTQPASADADVIVVGAGPGAAPRRTRLAQAGLDVLLLEKTSFPREKVCGDGLTPRAVKSLVDLGIDTSEANGFIRNRGLRIIGGGMRLELPWPDLATYPDYGLVRPRLDFDELLVRARAEGRRPPAGARPTSPARCSTQTGRVVGVTAKVGPEQGPRRPTARRSSSPPTAAAPAWRSRLGIAEARRPPDGRRRPPLLREPAPRRRHARVLARAARPTTASLLPGYGWVFGVGDGTSNVGLGILNTTNAWQKTDYKDLLARWTGGMPEEWQFDEEHATGPVRGGALPMGFNRTPALQPRRAARRRRRRRGQPVQRRGHRVRHGVRPARRRGRRAGAGPPRRARPASGRCEAYPAAMKAGVRRLLHARPGLRARSSATRTSWRSPPATACRARCS